MQNKNSLKKTSWLSLACKMRTKHEDLKEFPFLEAWQWVEWASQWGTVIPWAHALYINGVSLQFRNRRLEGAPQPLSQSQWHAEMSTEKEKSIKPYSSLGCNVRAAHDLGPSQWLLSLSSLPQSHKRRHFWKRWKSQTVSPRNNIQHHSLPPLDTEDTL